MPFLRKAVTGRRAAQRTAATALGATFMLFTLAAQALANDPVPRFDARPGCRAGAESGITTKPDIDGCVRSELSARDELAKQWNQFHAEDRTRCVDKTLMGGPPSYIEVLTCLEIARDVRRLPKDQNTGLDVGLRRR